MKTLFSQQQQQQQQDDDDDDDETEKESATDDESESGYNENDDDGDDSEIESTTFSMKKKKSKDFKKLQRSLSSMSSSPSKVNFDAAVSGLNTSPRIKRTQSKQRMVNDSDNDNRDEVVSRAALRRSKSTNSGLTAPLSATSLGENASLQANPSLDAFLSSAYASYYSIPQWSQLVQMQLMQAEQAQQLLQQQSQAGSQTQINSSEVQQQQQQMQQLAVADQTQSNEVQQQQQQLQQYAYSLNPYLAYYYQQYK